MTFVFVIKLYVYIVTMDWTSRIAYAHTGLAWLQLFQLPDELRSISSTSVFQN